MCSRSARTSGGRDTPTSDTRARTEEGICRREGDYWTFVFEGTTIRVRDSRGVRYLAPLLRQPGASIDSVALVKEAGLRFARTGTSPDARTIESARISVTKALATAIARLSALHPALGSHLQMTIRRGYSCRYGPDPRHPLVWRS